MTRRKLILPVLALVAIGAILILYFSFRTDEDYRTRFSVHYRDAITFLTDHESTFVDGIRAGGGDPALLVPVVFPELMRYSLLRAALEGAAMKLLYIKGGKAAANLSIGRCQIKASFVEGLEQSFNAPGPAGLLGYSSTDEQAIRAERVARLEDLSWDVRYLACFFVLVRRRFHAYLDTLEPTAQIRFLASAYNHGFGRDPARIVRWEHTRYFPYGFGVTASQYNYGDIAVDFYRDCWRQRMAARRPNEPATLP